MKTVKLAPIIRTAANKYLYHPNLKERLDISQSEYSCCAVESCIDDKFDYSTAREIEKVFYDFARKNGCSTGSTILFNKYYKKEKSQWGDWENKVCTAQSQEIRYAWLHLLADLAEEEDIKIKV